ncbi:MAG: hypothetical protein ABSD75_28530 [Terriglobales bacterium]|jgi:hypothetical protein
MDNASNSPQTVSLTGDGQDFSITVASSNQTVSQGRSATYTLSVNPCGGFIQVVQLSCDGPAGTVQLHRVAGYLHAERLDVTGCDAYCNNGGGSGWLDRPMLRAALW